MGKYSFFGDLFAVLHIAPHISKGGLTVFVFRSVDSHEKELIDKIVELHHSSFKGFFLSTLHPGFLRQLYMAFAMYKKSELIVALDDKKPIGFIAFSFNTKGAYRYMLWRRFFPFFWYSFLSFVKKPAIVFKMFSALSMPYSHTREADYVKVFSIAVDPDYRFHGIGTKLINEMKKLVDFTQYEYITLETDAVDNDNAINFYIKNGFKLSREFFTFEGRKMNKYHYREEKEQSDNDQPEQEQTDKA